jgi:hypothetical protein
MKTKKTKEPKIIGTKTWTIKMEYFDDGSQKLIRTNGGFNPYELIGLAFKSQIEILDQVSGKIRPTTIERNIIKD